MVIASELRPGMVIRFEGQVYKVLEVESKAGAAKMGGVVKATLSNLHSGRMLDQHMRPQERLEDLELERHNMEFLYSGDNGLTFMNPVTFEQVEIAREMLGPAEKFLQPEMELPVEFFEGKPVSVVLPQIVEVKVETTTPPIHAQQDSAFKEATLENGLEIRVPLFIAPGETVRVEVRTGKYLDRVRADKKKGA
ncbi:MAG TPA: elongation factor P [Candidatus Binatia bacterium]|jgi:elongation factor P|nr:elongation factor P [Candidatus Binatia bacterium]